MKVFTLTSILFAVSVASAAREIGNGAVEFVAIGRPSLIKIKGKGDKLTGDLNVMDKKISGILKFGLDSLKTGIGLRDEHTKEKYLEVAKFPEATLTIKDQELPEPGKSGKISGELNLHGVQKNIETFIEVKDANKAQGQFELNLSDFKIEIPKYMGVTVADTVKVTVELELKK